MTGKCKQPNWNEIVKRCEEKIKAKYPEYGNSWVGFFDSGFWNKRLQGEVNEVKKLNMLQDDKKIEELIDVINVCAMQITNLLIEEHKQHQREMVMMRLGI